MNQPNLPTLKHISHSNLGAEFEDALARTHHYYAVQKLAQIDKNPVEWRYTNAAQYEALRRTGADITAKTNTGRFIKKVKSDVDFSGAVKSAGGAKYICFDAKQIKGKSFPLSNVREHQIRILREKEELGAVAGLLIFFSDIWQVFFVSAGVVDKAIIEMLYKKGKKSLSLAVCKTEGIEIPFTANLVDWYQKLFAD